MSESDKKALSKDMKDQTTDLVQKKHKLHFKIMLVMFSPNLTQWAYMLSGILRIEIRVKGKSKII